MWWHCLRDWKMGGYKIMCWDHRCYCLRVFFHRNVKAEFSWISYSFGLQKKTETSQVARDRVLSSTRPLRKVTKRPKLHTKVCSQCFYNSRPDPMIAGSRRIWRFVPSKAWTTQCITGHYRSVLWDFAAVIFEPFMWTKGRFLWQFLGNCAFKHEDHAFRLSHRFASLLSNKWPYTPDTDIMHQSAVSFVLIIHYE